jgi:hypothetical protein
MVSDQNDTMTSMEQPVRISPSVRSVVENDGAVLLDIEQNLCMSLNPVAGFIWARIQQQKPRQAIFEDLAAAFTSVDRGQLAADFDQFWRSLLDSRVVKEVPS